MSITTRSKINNTSSPSRKVLTASTNITPVIFDELKQLIEEKFETIENKITSVEKHMKDQHQEHFRENIKPRFPIRRDKQPNNQSDNQSR